MLTPKAKQFIKKYQQGAVVPNSSMYQQNWDQGSDQVLNASRAIGKQNIPFLSSWTRSLVGGWDVLQSFKDKKKQKAYEQQSKEATQEAYDRMRLNSFYKTPYAYQDGGLLNQAIQQEQNQQMDQFQQFYDFNSQAQKDAYNKLKAEYEQKNAFKKQQWQNRLSTGLAEHIGAGAQSFAEYWQTFGGGMGGGAGAMGGAKAGGSTGGADIFANFNMGSGTTPSMQRGGFLTRERLQKLLKPHYYSNYQQGGVQPESTYMNMPLRPYKPVSYTEAVELQNRAQMSMDEDAFINGQMTQREFLNKRGQVLYSDNNKLKSKDRYREKQDGGEMESNPQTNPQMDLYSPEFDPNVFLGIAENEVAQAEIEDKEDSTLLDWVFSDDGMEPADYDRDTNDSYFAGNQMPISQTLQTLQSMGLEPSSTIEGEHNPGSAHYQGKAIDLGLNTTFGGDKAKMDEFYNFLNSAEGKKLFPNVKVRDERSRPLNQKVWSGSHIHLELE